LSGLRLREVRQVLRLQLAKARAFAQDDVIFGEFGGSELACYFSLATVLEKAFGSAEVAGGAYVGEGEVEAVGAFVADVA
jgi:hypothetical protein